MQDATHSNPVVREAVCPKEIPLEFIGTMNRPLRGSVTVGVILAFGRASPARRCGPRGAMNGIAQALPPRASADVAAYFASRSNGLASAATRRSQGGDPPGEDTPAVRLAFDGDPSRGIPPCAACHGPNEIKLGAPALKGQQLLYIERQLAAFAQGMRQNDIDERMRTIASQLTPLEMHSLAEFYAADVDSEPAGQ